MRLARIFLLALLPLLLTACAVEQQPLRLHMLNHFNVDDDALREIFREQSGLEIELVHSKPGQSALDALQAGEVDLALVNRSRPFSRGIRALLPVHKSVLHILAREGLEEEGEARDLRGKTIYVANNSLAGLRLVKLLAERQGLEPEDYRLVDKPVRGETDIIIYFGPIDPTNPVWKRTGFYLLSINDEMEDDLHMTRTEISFLVPGMELVELPARTYPIKGNDTPLQTLGVDTLLVARKDLSMAKAYLLTRALVEQKPRFTAIAPSLFSSVSASFDPIELNFPLHIGARRYMERNEPGFLERYAETINMLMYLAFLFITSFVAAARWRARRKKDNIDRFYVRALAIHEQVTAENREQLMSELIQLEKDAFDSLIREKLAANESFRIFTDLLARIREDLERA